MGWIWSVYSIDYSILPNIIPYYVSFLKIILYYSVIKNITYET